eukprot:scaffold630531_cov31-Prasinocladus_malaysianus.AAC.1
MQQQQDNSHINPPMNITAFRPAHHRGEINRLQWLSNAQELTWGLWPAPPPRRFPLGPGGSSEPKAPAK